jgi:hypothetical protein
VARCAAPVAGGDGLPWSDAMMLIPEKHREAMRLEGWTQRMDSRGVLDAANQALGRHCSPAIFAAAMTAWVRLSTPSFCKIADTCALMVASETPSS